METIRLKRTRGTYRHIVCAIIIRDRGDRLTLPNGDVRLGFKVIDKSAEESKQAVLKGEHVPFLAGGGFSEFDDLLRIGVDAAPTVDQLEDQEPVLALHPDLALGAGERGIPPRLVGDGVLGAQLPRVAAVDAVQHPRDDIAHGSVVAEDCAHHQCPHTLVTVGSSGLGGGLGWLLGCMHTQVVDCRLEKAVP